VVRPVKIAGQQRARRPAAEIPELTAVEIRSLNQSGYHVTGGQRGKGLYLRVTKAGGKSWAFIYTRQGKTRELGLGSVGSVPLARARELAQEARELVASGGDPIEQRQRAEDAQRAGSVLQQALRVTFQSAAERYMEKHRSGWKNPKHAQQWANTLEQYAYPVIGRLVVRDIEVHHVLAVLEPIWHDKTETAVRLRGRIEKVLDWCTAAPNSYRVGPNPAAWKGNLAISLPAPAKIMQRGHHASMHYTEVSAFVAQLRKEREPTARALEFTLLTGARTKEVCLATWDQIDFAAKVWNLPASVMKMNKAHTVPLTHRMLELLKAQEAEKVDGNPHVFPGRKSPAPMSNMTMAKFLGQRMGIENATVHGFRSSFRTWAADKTNFPREICEAALAHDVAGAVEGAYQRGTFLEKRRRLMEAWAAHCNTVHLGEVAKGIQLVLVSAA
jgi:integrase